VRLTRRSPARSSLSGVRVLSVPFWLDYQPAHALERPSLVMSAAPLVRGAKNATAWLIKRCQLWRRAQRCRSNHVNCGADQREREQWCCECANRICCSLLFPPHGVLSQLPRITGTTVVMRVTSPVSRAVPGGEKIQSVRCENGRTENASTYSLKKIIPVEERFYNLCHG